MSAELPDEVIHAATLALLAAQGWVVADHATLLGLLSNPRYVAARKQATVICAVVWAAAVAAADVTITEAVQEMRQMGGAK